MIKIIKANSVFANKPFPVPGPQDYDVKYPYSSVRMSMRSKLTDLSDRWVLSVPGPGAYQTVEMLDSQLKSRISGFPSVRNGKFDRSARKSEE